MSYFKILFLLLILILPISAQEISGVGERISKRLLETIPSAKPSFKMSSATKYKEMTIDILSFEVGKNLIGVVVYTFLNKRDSERRFKGLLPTDSYDYGFKKMRLTAPKKLLEFRKIVGEKCFIWTTDDDKNFIGITFKKDNYYIVEISGKPEYLIKNFSQEINKVF
jgi:hypothetical protein